MRGLIGLTEVFRVKGLDWTRGSHVRVEVLGGFHGLFDFAELIRL